MTIGVGGDGNSRPGFAARRVRMPNGRGTVGVAMSDAVGAQRLVSERRLEPRLTVRIGDLLNFRRVFDGIALRVNVVREQVVAKEMPAWAPDALDAAFTGEEDRPRPLLPVLHLERRVVERNLAIARFAERERMMVGVARPEAESADE